MRRSALLVVSLLATAACTSTRPVAEKRPAEPARPVGGGTSANPAEQWILAFPNTSAPAGISEIIPASADEVYAQLAEAYAAAGIEVAVANSRERTLGNEDFRATRRLGRTALTEYVNCGEELSLTGSMAASKAMRLSVLSTVTPSGESCRLSTRVQAAVTTGERGGAVICQSTGALETTIARTVKLRLLRS